MMKKDLKIPSLFGFIIRFSLTLKVETCFCKSKITQPSQSNIMKAITQHPHFMQKTNLL